MNRRENAQTRTSGGRYLRVGAALIICAGCLPLVTSAQVPPPTFDGSLGTPGVAPLLPVDNPATGGLDYEIPAARGQAVGGNLFHSFSEFNINTGESATYTAPQPFDNVISRVTGSNPSNINGLIRSEIEGADFWFINPNGIAFGPGSSLDVLGGFHASTAEAVRFESGESYETTAPVGTILTVANPIGFGFLNDEVGEMAIFGSELRLRAGQPISLVGGTTPSSDNEILGIHDSDIRTSDSEITIASVRSTGEIDLNLRSEGGAELSGDLRGAFMAIGDTTIRNDAFTEGAVTTIELLAGTIGLRGTEVASIGSGTASAGDVRLRIGGLELSSNSRISVETTGLGAGGKLEVVGLKDGTAGHVQLFGSSQLNSDSTATGPDAGKAGDILIVSSFVNIEDLSAISATTIDGGAGSISLNVDGLALLSGGTIRAGTSGTGDAGEIRIRGTLFGARYDDTRDPDFVLGEQFLDAGEIDRLLIPRDLLGQSGSHPFGIVAAFDNSLPPDSMETPVKLIAQTGFETSSGGSPFGTCEICRSPPLVHGLVGATDDGLAIHVSGIPDFEFMGSHDEAGPYSVNVQLFDPDNLPAGEYLVVDGFGSGIFNSSTATGPAAGKAGDISIMATSIGVSRYGTIEATTIDGGGGEISLNADDLRLRSGGAIRAGTTGTGDAGVIEVRGLPDFGSSVGSEARPARSVTIGGLGAGIFNNSEAIHTDAGPAGAAGSISIEADTLVVRNQGQVVATTVDGRGREVTVDAGRLEVRSNGQVAASTGGRGTGGTVTVNTDEVEVRGFDPEAGDCGSDCDLFRDPEGVSHFNLFDSNGNNGEDDAPTDSPLEILTAFFGTGIFSNSTAKGADAGRGGDVKITARAVTVSDGGEIGANTVDGPGGEVSIAGVRGDDGEPLTTVSVLRGGRIWANSEGLGRGGTINLGNAATPLKSVTVEGESQDRLQRPNLLAAFYRRFDFPDYRFTSSSPLQPSTRTNVDIPGSEIDPGNKFNELFGFVAAFEAPQEGDASPLVARSNFEFSSGGSPLADGAFGAPVVRGYFDADGSLSVAVSGFPDVFGQELDSHDVSGDYAISFQVLDPVLIPGRASSLSSRALAAGDAGSINVHTRDAISVTQSAEITAQTSGPGAGGRVTLNSDLVSITDSGLLTANTTGPGQGGDIVVEARQLELSGGGRIEAGSRPEPITLVPAAAFDGLRYDLGRPADLRYDSSSGLGPMSPEEVQRLDFGLGMITEPTIYIAAFDVLEGDNTEPVDLIARSNFEAADVGSPLPDSAPGPLVRGFANAGDTVQMDVTGYADLLFNGDHRRSGDYAVLVQTQTVELLEAGDAGSITVTGRGGAGTAAQSVSVSGLDSGLISESTGRNAVIDGAAGKAGNVTVTAESLRIEDGGRISAATVDGQGANGEGGSITLNVDTLSITGGAQATAATSGSGAGGDITVQGLGGDGTLASLMTVTGEGSGISTDSGPLTAAQALSVGPLQPAMAPPLQGPAGDIRILAKSMVIWQGGSISANTVDGPGGTITLSDLVSLVLQSGGLLSASTAGDGDGGQITITINGDVRLDGGLISTNAAGLGAAGSIVLDATGSTVELLNGATISVSSTAADGTAGDIELRARDLRMTGSSIAAEALADGGFAGIVNLVVNGNVVLTGSQISGQSASATQAGGSFKVSKPKALVLRQGSSIVASSASVAGGTATIEAEAIVFDSTSTVSGTGGVFTVGDVLGTVQQLPDPEVVDAASKLETRCTPQQIENRSSLVVRDTQPGGVRSPYLPADLAMGTAPSASLGCRGGVAGF